MVKRVPKSPTVSMPCFFTASAVAWATCRSGMFTACSMAGNDNIRVTTLYPGAVASELKFSNGDAESAAGIQAFYDTVEIPADSIARAVAYAIEQPENVAVNEITIRPAKQEF